MVLSSDNDPLGALAEESEDEHDTMPQQCRHEEAAEGLESLAPPPLRRFVTEPEVGSNRISFSALTSTFATRRQSLPTKDSLIDGDDDDDDDEQSGSINFGPGKTDARQGHNKFKVLPFRRNQSMFVDESAQRNSLPKKAVPRGSDFFSINNTITKGFGIRLTPRDAELAQDTAEHDVARATYRRYRVGDTVLVADSPISSPNLVNRHGYPGGGGLTPEEMRGPYLYVLATVKKVHFEEDAEYYTVTRADTGVDQRADAELMETIRTTRGEAAALRAAKDVSQQFSDRDLSIGGGNFDSSSNQRGASKVSGYFEICAWAILVPFIWLFHCFVRTVGERIVIFCRLAVSTGKRQGQLFLSGMKPFSCSMRLTAVNLLVISSTWYMFIDQARLAFLPRAADYVLAIISFVVWCILVLELIFEIFIRPDGYHSLIVSEKAYSPSTVRYINTFHLAVEIMSLGVFVPEFICLLSPNYQCSDRPTFSFFNAAFSAVLGPHRMGAFLGRLYLALIRLRVFGLVRHWKKMWINNTFVNKSWKSNDFGNGFLASIFAPARIRHIGDKKYMSDASNTKRPERKEDELINASNIGTALMVTNSHRALMMVCAIMGIFPLIRTLESSGGANHVADQMVKQLQALNLDLNNGTDPDECAFFFDTVRSWIFGVTGGSKPYFLADSSIFVLYLSIDPIRCENFIPTYDGVPTATFCRLYDDNLFSPPQSNIQSIDDVCKVWRGTSKNTTIGELADRAGVRSGAVNVVVNHTIGPWKNEIGAFDGTTFTITAKYNQTYSVQPVALSSFLLQIALLICIIGGLSILRRDSGLLVLGPLRRMLKIVARYAKNPLSEVNFGGDSDDDTDDESDSPKDKLGNYETEQLINAVSKITDLLRKCWGVAGADIISTNLATQEGALTEVFNPTVAGKSVYALFGFAAINGFDHTLRQLGGEVMILINDVAAVLHGEVFRWGFGDSGQCNKNLGAAFLMVFRIGLVKEVIQKLEQATDVVFSNSANKKSSGIRKRSINKKGNTGETASSKFTGSQSFTAERRKSTQRGSSSRAAMSVSLQSLPGIQTFTDRAVIGMLKSLAGIYRDNKLLSWKNDFRLGAGVGAFSVNMIFGMDAGWAVEGAVGSEYKIDATYLSPHVNMASRMMSACKQYGVSILLSQAVQELMSDMARSKLRHLDTVTVKGSSLKQKIYTYDARHKGVDFFLFSRSDEQADLDSDRYTPNIWNSDQDLRAMRQHVTEDFEVEFNKGRDAYLAGNWPKALTHLETANEIMVESVLDQGYIQDELSELHNRVLDGEDARAAEEELRNETGDGPSRRLIAYMESEGKVCPKNWKGYRPLASK